MSLKIKVVRGDDTAGPSRAVSDYPLRPVSFLSSVAIHSVVLVLMGLFGAGQSHQVQVRAEERSIFETHQVIYYKLKKKPPIVQPSRPIGNSPSPRGDEVASKTLIADSPAPVSKQQLIWMPTPEIKLPADVAAQDIIARIRTSLPVPAPPKPTPPPPKPEKAPEPKTEAVTPSVKPVKTFKPPPPVERKTKPILAELPTPPDASGGTAPSALASSAPIGGLGNLTAPPAPIADSASGGNADIDLVVVNRNSPGKGGTEVPAGVREGKFSKAPSQGEASSGSGSGSGVVVPGLAIREGTPAATVTTPQRKAGAPSVLYTERVRSIPLSSLSVPLRPSSRSIPRMVDARFQGRSVYTMVVPIENLPEYQGDWIMWFAEKDSKAGETPVIRAPVPYRKYEPVLPGAAPTTQGQRVQLSAAIKSDGKIAEVALLNSIPVPIQESILSDVASWEFKPATRNGSPVEVDVVIEIMFSIPIAARR
jgi:hypothetical protein